MSEQINTEHANDLQVGGSHYKAKYQHWDWAIDTNLGALECASTKYISRWWKKNGKEDIEKARSYVVKIKSAYEENRYEDANSKISDISSVFKNTLKFGLANNMNEDEITICYALANWSNSSHLEEVLNIMDSMLDNIEKAKNNRN